MTVKDYFDQVLVGRTLSKRGHTPQRAVPSGNRSFQQILKFWGNHRSNRIDTKSKGLTAVDYFKMPVRATCRYPDRTAPPESVPKISEPDIATDASKTTNPKSKALDSVVRARTKRRTMQLIKPTATHPSLKQPGRDENLIIEKSICNAARKYNLPAALIRGVIRAESNFEVKAVSRAGAQGLMQLMPGTAKELGVDNPFDIEQNIDGGTRYLRKMLDSFGGDIKVALAAYNAGPGAVEKYGGKVPPYQETEQYINRVLKFSKQMA